METKPLVIENILNIAFNSLYLEEYKNVWLNITMIKNCWVN